MRTEKKIEEQLELALESIDHSRFPAMTYEQGVEAALRWVLGEFSEAPMED